MSVIFSDIANVNFADLDPATIEASVISAYESIANTTLQPADPVRLFLESLAYVVTIQNRVINMAGQENLLAYATGAHLEHLGALMGVNRLPADKARCTVQFSLSDVLLFDVSIPSGTRVTTKDGGIVFATVNDAIIESGELSTSVAVSCVTAGASPNGLVAGQVCVLVDPVPYVESVENTDTVMYGLNEESDDSLRERIRIAPESFTVAGSRGQYIARVLEVSTEISGVSVTSPNPGRVDIRFLLGTKGEMPDSAMIEIVKSALSAEDVRPLTDTLTVAAPTAVPYNITGQFFLARDDSALHSQIVAKVAEAVEEYRIWQRCQPGRDIVPSKLIHLVMKAGAKRVALTSPVFTVVNETSVAREGTINFTFGGVEDW